MSINKEDQNLKIPKHVAIIADGNRRWAKENGFPTLEGHRRGSLNFENLIDKARELGIGVFTGWIFSTENWKRDKREREYLFNLTREFTKKYEKKFLKEKIRFIHLGRKDRLPKDITETLQNLEEKTKEYTDFSVCVAMDYGGHDELIRATKKLIQNNDEVSEENIQKYLDTKGIVPPPDFIIRTSGEMRLSGFMSWQAAYAELYFPKTYFPDFGPDELVKAIQEFTHRDRRFGGNSSKSAGDYNK